jgi:hypothetical protein
MVYKPTHDDNNDIGVTNISGWFTDRPTNYVGKVLCI